MSDDSGNRVPRSHQTRAAALWQVRILAAMIGLPLAAVFAVASLARSSPVAGVARAAQQSDVLAATTTITLTANSDTYVDSNHPGDTFGSRTYLLVGSYDDVSDAFALVRFPVSKVPDGAVVRRAMFRAYYDSYCGNTTEAVGIAPVVTTWDVQTVTWNTRPKTAAVVSSRLFGTSTGAYYAWPAITSLVQQWLSEPDLHPNYGIALKKSPGTPCRHFASSNSAHDPQLVIEYVAPTPSPAPSRTVTPTPTRTPTPTLAPPTATSTPTASVTAGPSAPPSVTPMVSDTPAPSASPTDTATATSTSSPTPSLEPSPAPTETPPPSPTPAPTPRRASIGGRVWHDADRDARIDADEVPMAAALLNLELADDFIAETTIDPRGEYVFSGLEPGRIYRVHVDDASVLPVAYRRTTASNPLIVVPQPGQDIRSADFGYAPPEATVPPARQRIDVWVMGVEVNQGLQDWVFTDLDHAGDVGGFVSLDESAFANPVIPGKPAVVRVYVGLRDSPDRPAVPAGGFPVTGRLVVQRGVIGAPRHTLHPVDNPTCSEHAGDTGQACLPSVGVFEGLGRQGLNTSTEYDLDLLAQRTHWEGSLNFVIPPEITATFDQSGVVITAAVEPVERVEVASGDNRFELQLSNVAAQNRLDLDVIRIRLDGDQPRPSTTAVRRALDQMLKLTPYDEVRLRRNRTYTDREFERRGIYFLGDRVGSLSECDSLWLDLFQTYGDWVIGGDTVMGITPTGIGLGHCPGLGWRIPEYGGLAFAELPRFAITSTLVVDTDDEESVATLAHELYHAHLDRRHVSNDHGESEGCLLEGAAQELAEFITGYDTDCWKPSLHPHGVMGEYPVGLRIGPDPGGLIGRLHGDRGAFGVRIEQPEATDWRLTLYDPCPTGPIDPGDPLDMIGLRWDADTSRYRCQVDDETVPHSFMSYGRNPWPSEDEFQSVTVPRRDFAARAPGAHADRPVGPDLRAADHLGAILGWGRQPGTPARSAAGRTPLSSGRGSASDGAHLAGISADPPALLAMGIITGGSQAAFVPLLPAPAAASLGGPANVPVKISARTADGRTLTIPAAVAIAPGYPQRWVLFAATLPSGTQPTRLALSMRGEEIAVATASAHAPTVHVVWPNGGETLDAPGPHTIRWMAQDDDGDPLTALVESSPDGGATWFALGRAGSAQSLAVTAEAGSLDPSGRALIRVTVTDGLNVASDISDGTFRVTPAQVYLPAVRG